MYALDTNILVYAHNKDSQFNQKAGAFVERVMNERDENGALNVCIPCQVLTEFIHVVTMRKIPKPITLSEGLLL